MWYDGTVRFVDDRPFFGCVIEGKPMEMGLFSDGFHFGCFVNSEFVSLGRALLAKAEVIESTGELEMVWMRIDEAC